MRAILLSLGLLLCASSAQAQLQGSISLARLNRTLSGRIVDCTHNHRHDRRIFSPMLEMPRDLYVYLPPGYDPAVAYPLILYLHGAFGDEHAFLDGDRIAYLDLMILAGEFPPVIVACPDGTYSGRNLIGAAHSLYINGLGGPFEDHLLNEVVPYIHQHYRVRPEREAHALLGISAGAFGALNLALKHPESFGAVAVLAAPANMRYSNVHQDPLEDFAPETYRWATSYDPNETVGVLAGGLIRIRARRFVGSVFGNDAGTFARITAENPADLLFRLPPTAPPPAIYLNFGGRDQYNFDGQGRSFAWLAAQRGLPVTIEEDPDAGHTLRYFRDNQKRAFHWLRHYLLPPVPASSCVPTSGPLPAGCAPPS